MGKGQRVKDFSHYYTNVKKCVQTQAAGFKIIMYRNIVLHYEKSPLSTFMSCTELKQNYNKFNNNL